MIAHTRTIFAGASFTDAEAINIFAGTCFMVAGTKNNFAGACFMMAGASFYFGSVSFLKERSRTRLALAKVELFMRSFRMHLLLREEIT
jgi:hypothetical protein